MLPECRVKPTAPETEVNWKGQFSKPAPSLILSSALPSVKSGLGLSQAHLHIHLFLSAIRKENRLVSMQSVRRSDTVSALRFEKIEEVLDSLAST